jgi:hypothetical protein
MRTGDVVRARRYGNRNPGNYVIDRMPREQADPTGATFSAYAHREFGAGANVPSETFMTFDATGAYVIRSYVREIATTGV